MTSFKGATNLHFTCEPSFFRVLESAQIGGIPPSRLKPTAKILLIQGDIPKSS